MTSSDTVSQAIPTGPAILQARRGDACLVPFGIYFLWPALLPFFLVSLVLSSMKQANGFTSRFPAGFLFLPVIVLASARQNRQTSLFAGMLLLLPLLVFAVIGVFMPDAGVSSDVLASPSLTCLLGTDGLGRSLLVLLVKGAVNIYLIAVVSTLIAISTGIWLGLKSIRQTIDLITSMMIQFIESIPMLVWIIIVLTAYSFWQVSLDPDSAAHFLLETARPLLMGVVIGICFMPNVFRLVRDKVRFFASEEFIDMTRAHGIGIRHILWFHILVKNLIPDIMISGGAIPGLSILTLLNIDYFFSISSFQVGAARYASWTQTLLTSEARNALLLFENIWLFLPASMLIIATSVGCYLYGAGLRQIHEQNRRSGLMTRRDSFLQKVLDRWESQQ